MGSSSSTPSLPGDFDMTNRPGVAHPGDLGRDLSHIKHFFSYWSQERETSGDLILAVPQSGTYSLLDDSLGSPTSTTTSTVVASEFRCHWFIAAPFSGVLAGKRPSAGPVSNGTECIPEMVVVDGALPEDVHCLVDFFYGAPLPTVKVDFARMKRMRRLADQLAIPLLRSACREWLRLNVDLRRAWGILGEALLDNDDVTANRCVQMLQTVPEAFEIGVEQMREISHEVVLRMVEQPVLPVGEDRLFSFVESFFAAKRDASLVYNENDANCAKKIVDHIRFPTISPDFFFAKVKTSGLLTMDEFATVCELLFAAGGEAPASAEVQGKFSTLKRESPNLVTVSSCDGKEKIIGYLKQEKICEFAAKIKSLFDFKEAVEGEEEERFLLKDVNGNKLKEKTLCQHAIKSDVAIVVRIIDLQLQKARGPLISLDVEETATIEEIRIKLKPFLGKTANFMLLYNNEVLENGLTAYESGLKSGEMVVIVEDQGIASTDSSADKVVAEETTQDESFKPSVECSEDPDVDESAESSSDDENDDDENDDLKAQTNLSKAFESSGTIGTTESGEGPNKGGAKGRSKKNKKQSQNQEKDATKPRKSRANRKNSGPPPGQLKKAGSKGSLGNSNLSLASSRSSLTAESHQNSFYKTNLCLSFKIEGKCPKGDACPHAHGEKELRPSKPMPLLHTPPSTASPGRVPPNAKTMLCITFKKEGACPKGASCQYAHGERELRKPPVAADAKGGGGRGNYYKMELCRKFKDEGSCPRGPSCFFAHGDTELRKPGVVTGFCTPMPRPVADKAETSKSAAAPMPLQSLITKITESSSLSPYFVAEKAIKGPSFWASTPKNGVSQPEWIKIEFQKNVVLKKFKFLNGRSKTETPERIQVIGMSRDMRQRQTVLQINDIVSKSDKDFHSFVVMNQLSFPIYQFNFVQSFGQSIAAGAPYVTGLKDFKMYGLEG